MWRSRTILNTEFLRPHKANSSAESESEYMRRLPKLWTKTAMSESCCLLVKKWGAVQCVYNVEVSHNLDDKTNYYYAMKSIIVEYLQPVFKMIKAKRNQLWESLVASSVAYLKAINEKYYDQFPVLYSGGIICMGNWVATTPWDST